MNRVILMGRLTRDPEVRYSQGERSMAIARYTSQWTEEAAEIRMETPSRLQILSTVWHLTAQASLQSGISARACVFLYPDVSRQEAM